MTRPTRDTVRRCVCPIALLLLAAPALLRVVQAQAAEQDEKAAAAIDELTVTGTRLRRDLAEDAMPLTVIDREQLKVSGATFLGEYVQQLPFVTGSPLNTSTGARGQGGQLSRGINTVELRGLGPERTLVLVNGRRMLPGGNGASGVVDLNMIPMALVERIEILKAGASVQYGADAVAGVVNIITRSETNGLEFDARGGTTSQWDGESLTASVVYGAGGERGRVTVGLEYSDQAAVGKGDRAFSRVRRTFSGPANAIAFDGSSAPPQGNFRTSLGRLTLSAGEDGRDVADFRPYIGDNTDPDTDRYNFNPFEDLQQPSERVSMFAQGRYAFSQAVNVFGEALWHQRDSRTRLAPLPFFTTRETDVVVSADNAWNPFGETLTDVRRRLVEAGPRDFVQDNQAWRVVLGADGLLGGWFWDASAVHGRNETDQRQTGDLLDSRLRLALGPGYFDPAGDAVCGTPAAPIAGCVPLNVFGGAGSITPAMLDYVGADLADSGYNEQTVLSANLAGAPLALPAGDLALAAGIEHRNETAADRPDPETVLGNTSGSARGATAGEFDSRELYVELGAPLLADADGAVILELDLGARYVDFSNFGSDTVFEAGLFWKPVETLRVRAAYSQAFRAANVRELFGGATQANPVVTDPCAAFGELPPTEIERCVAQGVPADGSFTQTGEETPELAGGNPGLAAERAEIVTAGFTWLPAALQGFELSVDVYDIAVDDGIASLGAETILDQCLATGADAFCGRIERAPDGAIQRIQAQLQNLAAESARGIDVDARYSHDAFGGTLAHRLLLSHVAERDLVAFPGAEPLVGAGGYDRDTFGAIPAWRGSYRLDWSDDRWRGGYEAQWIGAVDETGGVVFPGTVNAVGAEVYHDLYLSFDLAPRVTAALGIDNVTDEQPPFFGNADEANTDVSTYRLLGTTGWLRLSLELF